MKKPNRSPLRILLPVARAIGMLVLVGVLGLGAVCGLVLAQGQRSEATRVDAIVILSGAGSPSAHLDHAETLYEEGHATRLLLVGHNAPEMQQILIGHGLPEAALLPLPVEGTRHERMQHLADIAYQQRVATVLLVDEPQRMLLNLKMAQDAGLTAYGAPLPAAPLDSERLLAGGLAYWQYVLLGRS